MLPAIAARAWPTRSTPSAKGSPSRLRRPRSVRERRRRSACRSLHADQLSNLHGAALAARFGALSADHLEYADERRHRGDGPRAGTVAVVLPGAFYFIRETQLPPIDAMRRHGVPIALATDCNPGTSPLTSLLLTMNMGAPCSASQECGRLAVGLAADFVFWDVADPAELSYRIAFNPCQAVIRGGQPV
jgi:imidazolonepropionase